MSSGLNFFKLRDIHRPITLPYPKLLLLTDTRGHLQESTKSTAKDAQDL